MLSDERLADELWCVVMTEDKDFRIIEPGETGATRENEIAEVELTTEERGKVHFYCFFGSAGRDDFSENLHFVL